MLGFFIIMLVVGILVWVLWLFGVFMSAHEEYRHGKARALGARARARIKFRKWLDG